MIEACLKYFTPLSTTKYYCLANEANATFPAVTDKQYASLLFQHVCLNIQSLMSVHSLFSGTCEFLINYVRCITTTKSTTKSNLNDFILSLPVLRITPQWDCCCSLLSVPSSSLSIESILLLLSDMLSITCDSSCQPSAVVIKLPTQYFLYLVCSKLFQVLQNLVHSHQSKLSLTICQIILLFQPD